MKKIRIIKNVFLAILVGSFFSSCTSQNKESIPNENSSDISGILSKINKSSTGSVNFVMAAAISTPCVVHIKTTAAVNNQSQRHPFSDFFGEDFMRQNQQKREGSGSGVIVSANGFIMTNNHVIQNADEIEVILSNKNSFKAKLIGKDKDSDLALLKIEEINLPFINFSNSEDVMVGEWVLAVGNPFNLESTVTQGIVSAKGRSLNLGNNSTAIESFIQTDAAVNPGNSGGALVNIEGKLIGINTAIASPTGAYAGYAFAVPSNLVKKVFDDLKNFGLVQRAYLGVSIGTLTNIIAKQLGLDKNNGVLVADVQPNSSAKDAGLQKNDIIISIDNNKLLTSNELLETIANHRPGDKITIEFLRNGKIYKTQTVLKNANGNIEILKQNNDIKSKVGLVLSPLSEANKKAFRINAGLVIEKINEGIVSKTTEIKQGFVILSLNDIPVVTTEQFYSLIEEHKHKVIVLEGFYQNKPYAFQYAFRMD